MDCDLLPDGCDFAIEHLVSDRENQYLDGERHGLWRDYYEDGVKSAEGNYVNGRKEGICKWWWENGELKEESNYVDGLVEVLSIKYCSPDGMEWFEIGKEW